MLTIILFLGATLTFAQDASKQIEFEPAGDFARCPCPASVKVKSKDGKYEGWIADSQRVDEIVFLVKTPEGPNRTVTLPNPKKGIKFYADIGSEGIKELNSTLGLNLDPKDSDRVRMVSFKAPSSTPLYVDSGPDSGPNAGKLDGVKKVNNPYGKSSSVCDWKPAVLAQLSASVSGSGRLMNLSKTPECAEQTKGLPQNYCYGVATCGEEKKEEFLLCEASGEGACPSADKCRNPGTKPGNPSRLERSEISKEDGDKAFKEGVTPFGQPEFQGGAKLTREKPPAGICAMNFSAGGKNRTVGCLAKYCGSAQECNDDPCVVLTLKEGVEQDYPALSGSGKNKAGTAK